MAETISRSAPSVYAIVGLGNPGREYEKTRHNIGFMVLDELSNRYNTNFKLSTTTYLLAKTPIDSVPTFLIKPMTYMNRSGLAFRQFIRYYKIDNLSNSLIVLDDVNLPFGTVRLRDKGSSGGQKGMESIIRELATQDIPRLRIGIGGASKNLTSHVLSSFTKTEKRQLPELIGFAADAAESFVANGVQQTMNEYNRNILS